MEDRKCACGWDFGRNCNCDRGNAPNMVFDKIYYENRNLWNLLRRHIDHALVCDDSFANWPGKVIIRCITCSENIIVAEDPEMLPYSPVSYV